MALIKCKECGKDVSDKAKACPNCGNTILTKKDEENAEGMKILKIIIGIILLVWGIYHLANGSEKLLGIGNSSPNNNKITYNETDKTYTIELYNAFNN